MTVYLAQLLCPERHCLLGLAGEDEAELACNLGRIAGDMLKTGVLLPRCGICGSEELQVEVGRTKFKTMEEAQPALKALEAKQIKDRETMDALGLTEDAKEAIARGGKTDGGNTN